MDGMDHCSPLPLDRSTGTSAQHRIQRPAPLSDGNDDRASLATVTFRSALRSHRTARTPHSFASMRWLLLLPMLTLPKLSLASLDLRRLDAAAPFALDTVDNATALLRTRVVRREVASTRPAWAGTSFFASGGHSGISAMQVRPPAYSQRARTDGDRRWSSTTTRSSCSTKQNRTRFRSMAIRKFLSQYAPLTYPVRSEQSTPSRTNTSGPSILSPTRSAPPADGSGTGRCTPLVGTRTRAGRGPSRGTA